MIRKFQNTDVDRMAKIWLDTNIKAHDFVPAGYWHGNYEAVKEMFLQAEIYVYEEKETDQIQGFVGLSDDYIAGIFVLSEYQSKGIGKQLMDFVKNIRTQLRLSVYEKNIRAVKFYERESFVIDREDIDENTQEKEYEMVWKE